MGQGPPTNADDISRPFEARVQFLSSSFMLLKLVTKTLNVKTSMHPKRSLSWLHVEPSIRAYGGMATTSVNAVVR
jgi:hypothetical protein